MDERKPQIATKEEEVDFVRRFFPHLCRPPKRKSSNVREAIDDQLIQATGGPNIAAERMGQNMLAGLLAGGWNPGIAAMQAQAAEYSKRSHLKVPDLSEPAITPPATSSNPTPGLRSMVRRQFGLQQDEK